MDLRVFEAGASATPPAVPTSPSTGHPTDGNPATSTPPTVPGAFWFYQVAQEIRNAVVGAGLSPSTSDLTQLAQAIAILSGVSLITASGVPKGVRFGTMSMQWGVVSIAAGGTATFTYPEAFDTAVLHVIPYIGIGAYTGGIIESMPAIVSAGLSSCVLNNGFVGDAAGTISPIDVQILVIGY